MKKKILSFILIFIISVTFSTFKVGASDNGTFDETKTIDSSGELIPTQHAYLYNGRVSSFNVSNSEIKTLNSPEDIYYEETLDKYYIADTKNHRVLEIDGTLTNAVAYGEDGDELSKLKTPQGVFATPDGDIYVADSERNEVIVYSNGKVLVYSIHDQPLYGQGVIFKPTKIAVDSNKTMYVIDDGNANGIVQITKDGIFSGYFGANYITPDISYVIKFMFSSKKQKATLYRSPIAPTNLTFDYDGLVITVTSGLTDGALKRLNIAGNNMLPETMFADSDYLDVAVSITGNILTIGKNGYINEFDKEGNLLFTFGGKDDGGKINGLFSVPKAIEIDNDYNLVVLDKNNIQLFGQTEFASYVHTALALYNNGKYEESHEPWQKSLEMNNMFDLAHSGLGKAYLREMNYEKAMSEFKIAKDVSGYSEAYWEVRNDWLMNYAAVLIIIVAALAVVILILKKTRLGYKPAELLSSINTKIRSVKVVDEALYLFKFIKKPLNGFYEIKYNHKMSSLSATFWYVVLFIIIVLSNVCTGFIFNTADIEQISLLRIFSLTILPILLFMFANYLVSSITIGSGRMKDVYIGTICSFAPVICFMPFVIIISNFLTLNESFIYTMLVVVLWGWSFILLYFMIKDIQELQVGENNKNILLTVLTMLLFVALAFLLYILGSHLYTFIKDFILEVLSYA